MQWLQRARERLDQALAIDPENAAAHYNLSLVLEELGDPTGADRHRALHERYRTDDNAIERAVSLHRSRNPAANHAAEAVAIYALTDAQGVLAPEAAGQDTLAAVLHRRPESAPPP